MSIAQSILGFFGLHQVADESRHVRRTLLTHQPTYELPTAEVDNLKERFSAKRYVQHMRDAMDCKPGHAKGRAEWLNYINRLSPDDARQFWADFGVLVEGGELVEVLTPEQELEKREAVLEKWDEYNAAQMGLIKDLGVPSALMHQMLSVTHNTLRGFEEDPVPAEATALTPYAEEAEAAAKEALEAMDDAEVEVWAEDESRHVWATNDFGQYCVRCARAKDGAEGECWAEDDDGAEIATTEEMLDLPAWRPPGLDESLSERISREPSDAADEHMKWLAKQRKESAERLDAEQAAWPITPEEASNPSELVSRWEESASSDGVALTVTEDELGSASIVWHKPKEGETHEEEEQDEDEKHEVGQER